MHYLENIDAMRDRWLEPDMEKEHHKNCNTSIGMCECDHILKNHFYWNKISPCKSDGCDCENYKNSECNCEELDQHDREYWGGLK